VRVLGVLPAAEPVVSCAGGDRARWRLGARQRAGDHRQAAVGRGEIGRAGFAQPPAALFRQRAAASAHVDLARAEQCGQRVQLQRQRDAALIVQDGDGRRALEQRPQPLVPMQDRAKRELRDLQRQPWTEAGALLLETPRRLRVSISEDGDSLCGTEPVGVEIDSEVVVNEQRVDHVRREALVQGEAEHVT
jgi:hypothetical protein